MGTSCLYQWWPPFISTNDNDHQLSPLMTTARCLYYQQWPPAVSTISITNATIQSVTYDKINCYLLSLLSHLCSLHCLLAVNLLTWATKIICGVDVLIPPPNRVQSLVNSYQRLKKWYLVVIWVLWHINLCRLFNAKSIFYTNNQFFLKQFSLAWVHSLIVKNISISSYSV